MTNFLRKKYKKIALEGVWRDSFGEVEDASRWLIYGESGNGKTDFCVKLAKELSRHKKVAYLSKEEGDKSTLQEAYKRNEMKGSNVQIWVDFSFQDVVSELRSKRSPKIVIIDSIDYMSITKAQYIELDQLFPQVMLIFVCWGQGKKPMSDIGKGIEFMVDVKVHIEKYVAFPKSRYGGNLPYVIWREKAQQFHHFIE